MRFLSSSHAAAATSPFSSSMLQVLIFSFAHPFFFQSDIFAFTVSPPQPAMYKAAAMGRHRKLDSPPPCCGGRLGNRYRFPLWQCHDRYSITLSHGLVITLFWFFSWFSYPIVLVFVMVWLFVLVFFLPLCLDVVFLTVLVLSIVEVFLMVLVILLLWFFSWF